MHKSGRNDIKTPGASIKTLGEYIELKQAGLVGETRKPPAKKLSFEEWLHNAYVYEQSNFMKLMMKSAWEAAQENMQ